MHSPSPLHGRPSPNPSTPHHYATRIRQNSFIRPSSRLRQASDPLAPQRRIRPAFSPSSPDSPSSDVPSSSSTMPDFPPPHVMLHAEDANSKVFIAIGRSFLSVDNRAMTIKDLAEMTMRFGLVCQNASAAGQAITTYIRNHMHRCDTQQDYPLLSRHVLSGTPSDDELALALHSRSGGAHCALAPGDNRVTNFRRGTMVWYLSRAAGAPCPFARAGVRLCDYTENGKVGAIPSGPKERKRERDRARRQEQCGQKRKRLARACADGEKADSDSASESEKRPPKVKLTLRLKPSPRSVSPTPSSSSPAPEPMPKEIILVSDQSDSEEDSTSDDSDSSSDSDDSSVQDLSMSEGSCPPANFRRSPSVPYSVASPPPDSDDDDDHGLSPIPHPRRHPSAPPQRSSWYEEEDDMDWDEDDEEDEDEPEVSGSGLVASSGHFEDSVFVKQEPCDDIRRVLDEWDDVDSGSLKVMEVVTQAAAGMGSSSPIVKVEELDTWELDGHDALSPIGYDPVGEDEAFHIKNEEDLFVPSLITGQASTFIFTDEDDIICGSPLTPLSASTPVSEIGEMRWATLRRPSELMWKDAELLGPDSIHPHELEEGLWDSKKAKSRIVDGPVPSREVSEAPSDLTPPPDTPSAESDDTQDDVPSTPPPFSSPLPSWSSPESAPDFAALSSSASRPALRNQKQPSPQERSEDEEVVVYTCEPCTPAISATQVEGIPVYQMSVSSSRFLRRIDTGFVNLNPIAKHASTPPPPTSSIPNATHISLGSSIVCGTWVPLTEAQAFVQKHPLPDDLLDVFLSGLLFERFPPALQDFHRSNACGRLLNQFGPHFQSTLEAKRRLQSQRREVPSREASTPWERGMISYWDVEDHLLSVHPSLVVNYSNVDLLQYFGKSEDKLAAETPLSPTEQEMFQTLCDVSDWEGSPMTAAAVNVDLEPLPEDDGGGIRIDKPVETVVRRRSCSRDRPLRRSKRVANAMAARSRTRSSKRGSRSSLS
ncbi:hypothetical protein EW146_g8675 [Bondarzewia mesenterica]|uniref:GDS1 winged helix domain-containing protein n=1 Tax=Bondarzewia mesenterica TaxID=1095465 RepID=A0A4S4LCI9_9AGAM|nr:hypothetical protein EW146_g8675 [Bondarzewia mesenterica]